MNRTTTGLTDVTLPLVLSFQPGVSAVRSPGLALRLPCPTGLCEHIPVHGGHPHGPNRGKAGGVPMRGPIANPYLCALLCQPLPGSPVWRRAGWQPYAPTERTAAPSRGPPAPSGAPADSGAHHRVRRPSRAAGAGRPDTHGAGGTLGGRIGRRAGRGRISGPGRAMALADLSKSKGAHAVPLVPCVGGTPSTLCSTPSTLCGTPSTPVHYSNHGPGAVPHP